MRKKAERGLNAAAWFYGQPGFHGPRFAERFGVVKSIEEVVVKELRVVVDLTESEVDLVLEMLLPHYNHVTTVLEAKLLTALTKAKAEALGEEDV